MGVVVVGWIIGVVKTGEDVPSVLMNTMLAVVSGTGDAVVGIGVGVVVGVGLDVVIVATVVGIGVVGITVVGVVTTWGSVTVIGRDVEI